MVEVEFGSLDAANSAREEFDSYLCSNDNRSRKTVTFASDTPEDIIDLAELDAMDSRGDSSDAAGQVKLTDSERDEIDFRRTNVPRARAAKGAFLAEGVNDWLTYWSEDLKTVGEAREAARNAKQDAKGKNLDAEQSVEDKAANAARRAKKEGCSHAEDRCSNGVMGACEHLKERCGYPEDEVEDILGGTLQADTPTTEEETDQRDLVTVGGGEYPEIEVTPQEAGALRDSWTGYKAAVGDLGDAIETARQQVINARQAFEAINAIRERHGQEDMHADSLHDLLESLEDMPGDIPEVRTLEHFRSPDPSGDQADGVLDGVTEEELRRAAPDRPDAEDMQPDAIANGDSETEDERRARKRRNSESRNRAAVREGVTGRTQFAVTEPSAKAREAGLQAAREERQRDASEGADLQRAPMAPEVQTGFRDIDPEDAQDGQREALKRIVEEDEWNTSVISDGFRLHPSVAATVEEMAIGPADLLRQIENINQLGEGLDDLRGIGRQSATAIYGAAEMLRGMGVSKWQYQEEKEMRQDSQANLSKAPDQAPMGRTIDPDKNTLALTDSAASDLTSALGLLRRNWDAASEGHYAFDRDRIGDVIKKINEASYSDGGNTLRVTDNDLDIMWAATAHAADMIDVSVAEAALLDANPDPDPAHGQQRQMEEYDMGDRSVPKFPDTVDPEQPAVRPLDPDPRDRLLMAIRRNDPAEWPGVIGGELHPTAARLFLDMSDPVGAELAVYWDNTYNRWTITRYSRADAIEGDWTRHSYDLDTALQIARTAARRLSNGMPAFPGAGSGLSAEDLNMTGLDSPRRAEQDTGQQFSPEMQGTLQSGVESEEPAEQQQVTLTGGDASDTSNQALPSTWTRDGDKWTAGPYRVQYHSPDGRTWDVTMRDGDGHTLKVARDLSDPVDADEVAQEFTDLLDPDDASFHSGDAAPQEAAARAKKNALNGGGGLGQFTQGNEDPTATVAVFSTAVGGKDVTGAITNSDAALGYEASNTEPPFGSVEFVDYPFSADNLDTAERVEVVADAVEKHQPAVAVGPDVEGDVSLSDAVDVADGLLDAGADTVVLTPKDVQPSAIPDRFRVGFPAADFGSGMSHSVSDFRGVDSVHVLGGSPQDQRDLADGYGLPVASVDGSAVQKAAMKPQKAIWTPDSPHWDHVGDWMSYPERITTSLNNIAATWNGGEITTAEDVRPTVEREDIDVLDGLDADTDSYDLLADAGFTAEESAAVMDEFGHVYEAANYAAGVDLPAEDERILRGHTPDDRGGRLVNIDGVGKAKAENLAGLAPLNLEAWPRTCGRVQYTTDAPPSLVGEFEVQCGEDDIAVRNRGDSPDSGQWVVQYKADGETLAGYEGTRIQATEYAKEEVLALEE